MALLELGKEGYEEQEELESDMTEIIFIGPRGDVIDLNFTFYVLYSVGSEKK